VTEPQPSLDRQVDGEADGTDGHELASVDVSQDGVLIRSTAPDFPVDVLFDGRRIASFWLRRDTEATGLGTKGSAVLYRWPVALRKFLDGTTDLSLVDHVSGDELYRAEVALGSGAGRITVEDAQGNPLGLDKSNRLSRLFTSRSSEHLEPLLDGIGTVVAALEEAGVRPFLAYGTLLGAVRQGDFIGHDSDADIGYVSEHDHPVDASLESFRLQRRLTAMGFPISRYSGLAFKVIVRESDGATRGLDVFGGFVREGTLYLMGEVGHPFRREWLEPRSEVTLAGRTFPAPHEPERLLEAMYGPGWRVPDPAYKFETPRTTQRRLSGWFRGTRVGLDSRWQRLHQTPSPRPADGPSDFARWVRRREPDARVAVDVGCGTGRDVLFLARSGCSAYGLDYFPRDFRLAERRARKRHLDASFDWMNLTELRSVLVTGAALSRTPGPRVVLARHVVESTDRNGRENLFRLAKMVTRGSGRLYLQLRATRRGSTGSTDIPRLDLDRLRSQVTALGGRVVEDIGLDAQEQPLGAQDVRPTPAIRRWVITWDD
jgi:SAM-dependent methyltransferase